MTHKNANAATSHRGARQKVSLNRNVPANTDAAQLWPIDQIRVGKRHRKDMGDLNAQPSRHELLAAPNIGRAASAAVVLWLARHGLELQAKGAPSQGRLSHFTSPLAADRSHERNGWIRPPES